MPKNNEEDFLNSLPNAKMDPAEQALLASLPNEGQALTPTGLPKIVQNAAQVLTTPERGFRGLGVGSEKILSGVNPMSFAPGGALSPQDVQTIASNAPVALERAADATKPGYVPQEGEAIGAAVGETVGSLPLATALGGASNPNSLFLNVLRQAGAGGALSAIQQASEKGNVDIADVTLSAGVGAMLPLIRPTVNGVRGLIRSLARESIAGSTTLSREAAQEFIDNPKLLKEAVGTVNEVSKKVVATQEALIKRIDDVGIELAKSRKPFSIGGDLDQKAQQILENGLTNKTEQDLLRQSNQFVSGYKISDDVIMGKTTEKIPFKDQVRGLYETRKELDSYIRWRTSGRADVPPIIEAEKAALVKKRNDINTLLDKFAESNKGVKNLRNQDAIYSETRELYDNLQRRLANEDTAEQTLIKIQKGDSPDEILGLTGGVVDRLRKLEKDTGQKIVDPLRKELLAVQTRGLKAKGTSGFGFLGLPVGASLEAMGPSNVGEILQIFRGASNIVGRLAEAASSPAGKAAIISASNQRRTQ